MTANVAAALRDLAATLEKLKALQEWARLARQEARPRVPPSFRLDHHLEEEVRLQTAAFISTAMDIREALNDPAMAASPKQRARWRRRLEQLEEQSRQLDLTESFISA